MKIGIYAGTIPPSIFIINLVNGLAGKGYKIFIYGKLLDKNYKFLSSNVIIRGIPHKKIPILVYFIYIFIRSFFIMPKSNYILNNLIWKNSININQFINRFCWILPPFMDELDVFHIQWAKTLEQYSEFIEMIKCPVVLSLRGTHINVSPIGDVNIASIYRKYFPKINSFHAVSEAISKQASLYGASNNKIVIIKPAVDDKLLNLKLYNKGDNKSGHINIISIGRCHWIKGYTFALDAMSLLNREGVPFHYTIIADGKDSEHINYQIYV